MGTVRVDGEQSDTAVGRCTGHGSVRPSAARMTQNPFDRALIGFRAIVELAWVHSVVGGHEDAYATFERLQEVANGLPTSSGARQP